MEEMLNLRDLLQHEIDDLYSAEEQIIEALPKMAEAASNPALKRALNEHLQVTKEQKNRLDRVKKILAGREAAKEPGFLEKIFGSSKCKGTEGLIKEGETMMKQPMEVEVKDAAIIASAQKIEHYEISGYGTARAYAMQLQLSEVEELLTETLNEEYEADDSLTALAFFDINLEAEHPESKVRRTERNK
jgi:ferritin-like metal-binding protein YciE